MKQINSSEVEAILEAQKEYFWRQRRDKQRANEERIATAVLVAAVLWFGIGLAVPFITGAL